MASVNLTSAFFAGLQDSSGNSPAVGTTGNLVQLHQRNATPPALPTLTNAGLTSNGFFHNDQDPLTGTHYAQTGTPGFGAKGMRLDPGVYLSHNTFATSTALRGTWWADGILTIEGPLNTTAERYLTRHEHHGGILIDYISGSWRFVLENEGHDATTRVTFTDITVPISNAAIDSVPTPFYFRLVREIPATGTGEVHLVVDDGTTVQTQKLTGIAKPTTFASANHDLGFGSTGRLNFYWWRETSTEDAATVGTLQGTYWSTPKVFDTVSYYSHGTTSTADAGADDVYWHDFNLTQGTFGDSLVMNGGGTIKVRVAATNTAPTGSTSALFTGSYFTVQNINQVLADPQGRYLAFEWRYEPGTDWPLSMGSAHVFNDTATLATCSHFPTAQGSNPVTLPIPGEGDSGGTLPFDPELPIATTLMPRTVRTDMEYPYTVARPLGTVIRRSYRLTWLLNATDKATLTTFFEARDGGQQPFTWTAPGDSATSKAALTSDLRIDQLAPGVFEIQADIVEVF